MLENTGKVEGIKECRAIKISKSNIQYERYVSFGSLEIMNCSMDEYFNCFLHDEIY